MGDGPIQVLLIGKTGSGKTVPVKVGDACITESPVLAEALDRLMTIRYDLVMIDEERSDPGPNDTCLIIRHSFPEIPVMLVGNTLSSTGKARWADDRLAWEDMANPMVGRYLRACIENRKSGDSLRRMLFTFEQLPVSILICDRDGNVDYTNGRFSDMTGLGRDEIIAEDIREWAREKKDPVAEQVCAALGSESDYRAEVHIDAAGSNDERWLSLAVSPIENAEGKITHYVAIGEDITAGKIAEELIRQSEEHFRTLVHNINEYIYSVVFENGIAVSTYHSPKCTLVTGYTEEEMQNDRNLWFTMIHERDRDKVNDFIKNITENRKPATIEHRIIRKDGNLRWVMNTGAAQIDRDGRVSRIHGFIFDITERKTMEDELRKLTRALDESPVSVVVTDANGIIQYVNPTLVSLTGYTSAELIGQNAKLLMIDRQSPDNYERIAGTLRRGETWKGEVLTHNKYGEEMWELQSISPLKNKRGEITHVIAVIEDITERKRSEDSLRKRNEVIEKDLRLAQLIQRAFLPAELPNHEKVRSDYRYIPMDRIGGDYFALHPINGNDLSVFIGDVTGHGVSAALFLSLVKSATDRIWRKFGEHPDEYISQLNRLLVHEMSTVFLTAVYGLFHHNGGGSTVFSFCNGGHPYPVCYSARDGRYRQFHQCGTILGMSENINYGTTDIALQSGDRVFLFTDGIPEASNGDKEIIGFEEGLLGLFERSERGTLGETLDAVIDEVSAFRGKMEPDDDILLLGFEVA